MRVLITGSILEVYSLISGHRYSVNLIAYLPPPPTGAEAAIRAAAFKKEGMKMLRKLCQTREGRQYVPVGESGEPIWRPEKSGEFVVEVTKIEKRAGLQEVGDI